jgi:hypothetical protein
MHGESNLLSMAGNSAIVLGICTEGQNSEFSDPEKLGSANAIDFCAVES